MTLKTYIWAVRLITLISIVAFFGVVKFVDPEKSGFLGQLIFYGVLFFMLSGFFDLSLLFLRKRLLGGEAAIGTLGLSFRQAILLAILCVVLLILQSFRMLFWWDGILAVAGIFLAELYFLSRS